MKRRTKYILMFSIIAIVVFLDLLTKWLFGEIEFKKIIPHLIDFSTNNGNDGAAWGIMSGKKVLLITFSIVGIVMVFVVDHFLKSTSKVYTIALGMFVGGAIGNLFDRVKYGYVRDFIKFHFYPDFPTFNLADSFLCVSVVLLIIYMVFIYKQKNKGK